MSVSLTSVNRAFTKADIDGNGKLDRPEIAKASLNLMGQDDTESQTVGKLFATFVQGGKDGKGLLPDFDSDQAVSKADLSKLAASAGSKTDIGADDFKATFSQNYQEGGSTIDMAGLQELGSQNKSKFNFNPDDPGTFTNAVGSVDPGAGQQLSGLMGMFQQLATLFKQFFASQGNS